MSNLPELTPATIPSNSSTSNSISIPASSASALIKSISKPISSPVSSSKYSNGTYPLSVATVYTSLSVSSVALLSAAPSLLVEEESPQAAKRPMNSPSNTDNNSFLYI